MRERIKWSFFCGPFSNKLHLLCFSLGLFFVGYYFFFLSFDPEGMGKAIRWLKGLLGMKKEKEKDKDQIEHSSNSSVLYDKKEKKRWSFAKSGKDVNAICQIPLSIARNIPATDAARLGCYIAETEKEQNKHAIAVAAATAAAADAAVVAAQAAMAVVRLTSNGRGTLFGGVIDRWAAMKIQTLFRGYLVSGFFDFGLFHFSFWVLI